LLAPLRAIRIVVRIVIPVWIWIVIWISIIIWPRIGLVDADYYIFNIGLLVLKVGDVGGV